MSSSTRSNERWLQRAAQGWVPRPERVDVRLRSPRSGVPRTSASCEPAPMGAASYDAGAARMSASCESARMGAALYDAGAARTSASCEPARIGAASYDARGRTTPEADGRRSGEEEVGDPVAEGGD